MSLATSGLWMGRPHDPQVAEAGFPGQPGKPQAPRTSSRTTASHPQPPCSSRIAVTASSMIRRMAASAAAGSLSSTARAHRVVQRDRLRVGAGRHHPVVGAAGQHLGDHLAEGGHHLVAAGLEQGLVERHVRDQVGLEVAGAAVHDHLGDRRGEPGARARGWPAPRPGRRRAARSRGAARSARAAGRRGPRLTLRRAASGSVAGRRRSRMLAASTVTPTRRREVTIPIDSSTRIASRATGIDTAYSRAIPSRVSTAPEASAPETSREPRASRTPACRAPLPRPARRSGDGSLMGASCHSIG